MFDLLLGWIIHDGLRKRPKRSKSARTPRKPRSPDAERQEFNSATVYVARVQAERKQPS